MPWIDWRRAVLAYGGVVVLSAAVSVPLTLLTGASKAESALIGMVAGAVFGNAVGMATAGWVVRR